MRSGERFALCGGIEEPLRLILQHKFGKTATKGEHLVALAFMLEVALAIEGFVRTGNGDLVGQHDHPDIAED